MTNTLLDQAKASTDDQTVTTEFVNDISPAGPTFARFVGYVEVGVRAQRPYQGVDKKPCAEVRLTFELNGPKHTREIELEGGEKKIVTNVISVKITKKQADNSGFIKLFRKMTYGRDIKNFAQMLGEPFLITIVHAEGKDKDGKDVTYANMKDSEFNYLIGAPAQVNPATGETVHFDVPEARIALRLLLWDQPTDLQWKSLFIDGTKTVKRDGKDVEISRNWLQEDIVTNALNIGGSPLEIMLAGMDDLEMPGDTAAPEEVPEPKTKSPTKTAKTTTLTKPKEEAAAPPPADESPLEADTAAEIAADAATAAQALFDSLGIKA